MAQQPYSMTPRARRLMAAFWVVFVVATLLLMFGVEEQQTLPTAQYPLPVRFLISPLMLLVQWALLLRFQPQVNAALRRVPLPRLLKYLLLGLLLATVLGNNFAVNFGLDGNDLNPNPLLNTVLYFGPYGGVLLALWFLGRIYRLHYLNVFWLTGLFGAATEQGAVAILLLIGGDIFSGTLLLFHIVPAYGVAFASIWIAMPPEELPQGQRRVGPLAVLLFLAVTVVLFYLCALLWYGLIDLVFGTSFLQL